MHKRTLIDLLRAWPWLAGAILATTAVALIAPYQLGVLVWSLSKLSLGAYLGYWIDRSVFYYGRPHEIAGEIEYLIALPAEGIDLPSAEIKSRSSALNAAMLRRAIIIAAAIIALGLGV